MVRIDAYHPLVASDHDADCAAMCTEYGKSGHGCQIVHRCWCKDGGLSYARFAAKHPDVAVAETEGIKL
jgi:hypothetical protein